MNKILLVIQREYLSRVKKKSFILMTLLVPVLFIGMFAFIIYITAKSDDLSDVKKVEVVDESGLFKNKLKDIHNLQFSYTSDNYTTAKNKFKASGNNYLLYIPASLTGIEMLSENKTSITTMQTVEDQLSGVAQTQRLLKAGIDTAVLAKAQTRLSVEAKQITETGEKDAQTYIAFAIGFISAFLIYMSLFIFGVQVMRGVLEEKTSRIIEVIISSVKPFQLMMGKIIGIGMVGLTQFLLWIILSVALSGVTGLILSQKGHVKVENVSAAKSYNPSVDAATNMAAQQNAGNKIMQSIESIPLVYTLSCFLFYFFFGYLLYSALFAAVGSAVDNETDTQQFMLPITLPLIFTFAIAFGFIINNPDSTLSIWLSLIPFTAPIAMMVRIPFGVPGWQLALSMLFMILGFLFTTWVAARIYRVGILMYGKKPTYKELAKWFFYKE